MQSTQTKRPKASAISQQQLQGWKPLMTFKDASIFFIVIGVITLGLGEAIFLADQSVVQYKMNYTNCNPSCSVPSNLRPNCTCLLKFMLPYIPGPVYFYYGLTTFYENHRKLVGAFDMSQLTGNNLNVATNSEKRHPCWPLLKDNASQYYAPCGQLANVIFNDTFLMVRDDGIEVPWLNNSIALYSDLRRYKSPANWSGTATLPNWSRSMADRGGFSNDQELMVWLRSAPFPTFWKLHRVLNATSIFDRGLPNGFYSMLINYNYPVTQFGGEKFFVISNASWMGGRSIAMAILFFITGIFEVLVGLIFVPLHYRDLMHKAKQKLLIYAPKY